MNDTLWIRQAVRRIEADFNRSADTHSSARPARLPGVSIYCRTSRAIRRKPQAPPGALALPLLALQRVAAREEHRDRVSSGSTAVSEAYSRGCSGCRSSR